MVVTPETHEHTKIRSGVDIFYLLKTPYGSPNNFELSTDIQRVDL